MADNTTTDIIEAAASIPGITLLNYANGLAFLLNIVTGMKVQKDQSTLSAKYQTLVTPTRYALVTIWGLIFLSEFIWTVLQFLPEYRTSSFVVDIVGYYFVYACLFQCMWSICFGYEQIALSFLVTVAILGSLMPIVYRIDTEDYIHSGSFWVMEFPMELHTGWIMAATLVDLNAVFVSCGASSKIQTMMAWLSLAVVLFLGIFVIAAVTGGPPFVIPCVLAWASFAIFKELEDPKESIANNFSPDVVLSTKATSKGIVFLILAAVVVRIGYDWIEQIEW